MKRGFLLGKFMPPHQGHIFLCEAAARMAGEVTVLVCSTESEPIPGHLRFRWMQQLLPSCRVVHMHRDIPQEPSEHPDFWPTWKAAIGEHHPEPIDLVFGSEDYVHRLAAELGATPVLIDPEREVMPVSSSAVRERPISNWGFIPSVVRPYYQKRICILGPESSGKSTFVEMFSRELGATPIAEYGRLYDAYYRRGKNWCAGDFVMLARSHVAIREAIGLQGRPLLIEDTDPIQTAVWADYLLGNVPPELEALVAETDPADLYLLLSPDVDWRDDGTRYDGTPETRARFYEACLARLEARGLSYRIVAGKDYLQRANRARTFVRDFVGSVFGAH